MSEHLNETKQAELKAEKAPTRVAHVRRDIGRVVVRRFDPKRDSFGQLTAMLHRSFARLGMGLNCSCVNQPVQVTQARALSGVCYVSVCDGRVVGTMTLCAPERTSPCELYRRDDVINVQQLGVEPSYQSRGIGESLLMFAEHWAATNGYAQLALDTPQPAAHLLSFYRVQGFRIISAVQFDGKHYDSLILAKPAVTERSLATWSGRLELPRDSMTCVA